MLAFTLKTQLSLFKVYTLLSPSVHVRNLTCGRCTRSDAGTSSLLETASGSSMRINSGNPLQRPRAHEVDERQRRREETKGIIVYMLVLSFVCTNYAYLTALSKQNIIRYYQRGLKKVFILL